MLQLFCDNILYFNLLTEYETPLIIFIFEGLSSAGNGFHIMGGEKY